MKPSTFYVVFLYLIVGCNDGRTPKNCITSDEVSIEYIPPYTFSKEDTLYIDTLKFAHTYSMDSVRSGYYLPKDNLILFEVDVRQAKQKMTPIGFARILGNKLKATQHYELFSVPELLTTGKLKIRRLDGKDIKACTSQNYPAVLKTVEKTPE